MLQTGNRFAVSRRAGRSVNQRIDRQAREGDSATGTDIGVDIAQRAGETAQMEQGKNGSLKVTFQTSSSYLLLTNNVTVPRILCTGSASANSFNNENALQLYFREHGVYGTVVHLYPYP